MRESPAVDAVDPQKLRFNTASADLVSSFFTGRDPELAFIESHIKPSGANRPARCVIYGMTGIGKSQLVRRFANLGYESHVFDCILWVSATAVDKISRGIVDLLKLLPGIGRYDPDQNAQLVDARRWLETTTRKWLVIFDDVTLNVIPFLREHLPRENNCGTLIFTTRTCEVAEGIVPVDDQQRCIMELKALTVEDSATLLRKAAGYEENGASDQASAEGLVKQIGCLPLAVEQAGAFMKQKHIPASELQTMYDKSALHHVSLFVHAFLCPLINIDRS